jgi:glycerol-3-phosphate dehydrogenase
VRLVQGSHIVIRRKFEHPKAYFFQNSDERIFFAIPYEQEYTLIGTTDQDFEGDPSDVKISDAEIDYLCDGASQYFSEPVTRDDIVWTFSGVRPLYDDGASKAQEATRDYVLRADGGAEAKVINVFGGKITTYRRLAESVLRKVEDALGAKGRAWTRESVLPGGEFGVEGFAPLLAEVRSRYPFLQPGQSERLVRAYGLKCRDILGGARSGEDLGEDFGHGLTEAEVRYQMKHEFARLPRMWCGAGASSAFAFHRSSSTGSGFHGRKQTTAAPCSGIGISDAGTEKRQQESRSGSAHR